jgi:hypothetical protein
LKNAPFPRNYQKKNPKTTALSSHLRGIISVDRQVVIARSSVRARATPNFSFLFASHTRTSLPSFPKISPLS